MIKISDYFKEGNYEKYLTKLQKQQIYYIRKKLNSFKTVKEQKEWIKNHRSSEEAKRFDLQMFDIPISDAVEIYDDDESNQNLYYNLEAEEEAYKIDKGKDGHSKKEKEKRKKKERRGRISFFGILSMYKKYILIAAIFGAFSFILFISGILSAIRHSPFIFCGSDGIVKSSGFTSLNENEIEQYTNPEFIANLFIEKAASDGWKPNAIIGALAYMLQEAGGTGTFAYEGYYSMYVKGPRGEYGKLDTTLDNKAWLAWLKDANTHQNTIKQNTRSYNQGHYAIGIGLLQDSDVYDNGVMSVDNATKLIELAESQNKYWQDPGFQVEYVLGRIRDSGDADASDPKTFNGSADEYCRRVTTSVGMPGWSWTDNNSYIDDHVKHVSDAQKKFENRTSSGFAGFSSLSNDLCKNMNKITGSNASIAEAALTIVGGETKVMYQSGRTPDIGSNPNFKNFIRVIDGIEAVKGNPPNSLPIYASCDLFVSTSVAWAGADDNFPQYYCPTIMSYFHGKQDKWVQVKASDGLFPGDIGIRDHHVWVILATWDGTQWTDNSLVQKYFPGSNANVAQASYFDYYPHLGRSSHPDQGSDGVEFWRNIKPEENSRYKNVK